jgi:hypothetical protein
VINGCGAVGGGDEDVDGDGEGRMGSDDVEQPDDRIVANNAATDKMQLSVLGGMAFPPARVNCRKCDGNHKNSVKIIEESTVPVKGGTGVF